jgi:acyl-CoA synthetase (AMP-forming)/AMP-acid ligase II
VAGRKKDLIIVGGKNVYPQDLEALACEVPGVHPGRTVAFGLFDETQGTEEVVIIAEVDTEDDAEHERIADEIRKYVTKNSAIAMRHVRVVGPKWVLKTSSGKVARTANKEKFIKELEAGQAE